MIFELFDTIQFYSFALEDLKISFKSFSFNVDRLNLGRWTEKVNSKPNTSKLLLHDVFKYDQNKTLSTANCVSVNLNMTYFWLKSNMYIV